MKRSASAALYRRLLRLYPAGFREEYQEPMEQQFQDEYREARTLGERARLWTSAIADVATEAPVQFAREVGHDLRYGLRTYRRQSAGGLLAVGSLALAIGAGTGVFGVVHAVLLRTLPFAEPENLVEIQRPPVTPLQGRAAFLEWQASRAYLDGAATYTAAEVNFGADGNTLRVKTAEASANLFDILGVEVERGRGFSPEEDTPGRTGVAVLGHALWMQAFAGDPGVLGRKATVNGSPVDIIGVAPPRFDYPEGTALWLPSAFDFQLVPKRGAFFHHTVGRLSASHDAASELFAAEIVRTNPTAAAELGDDRARLIPLRSQLAGPIEGALWVLGGLVLFVLLAACANVAQVLLARAWERREEFAMRSALGAGRGRLLQQQVTEAVFLTACATGLGLLVAHQVCGMASLVVPAQLASQQYTALTWPVTLFAAALAVTIGLVFGLLPGLLNTERRAETLCGHAAAGGRKANRVRWWLMAAQGGLTLALAAGSFATGRAFLRLLDANLGFEPASAVTLSVSLQGTLHSGASAWTYYEEALRRLRAVPGVESAGAVNHLPLANQAFIAGSFELDSGEKLEGVVVNSASEDYFRSVGTAFVAGRDFISVESQPAVIVNEAFAEKAGLGDRVVNRLLTSPWSEEPFEIVGLVETARFAGPSHPGVPMVYWPARDEPPSALTLAARVRGDAAQSLAACRDAVRSVDAGVPVYDVKTFEQRLSEALARPQFFTQATLFLGALAMFVAATGIYGTAVRSVAQRRREMGVRMALGATSGQVRTAVLRQTLAPIAVGALAGAVGALGARRYVGHLIVNAEPVTWPVCVAAALVLLGVAAVATWRATARVVAIDPAEAVRAD